MFDQSWKQTMTLKQRPVRPVFQIKTVILSLILVACLLW